MTIHSILRAACCVLPMLLAGGAAAQAAEIKLMVSAGFVPVMRDLTARFEAASGHKLAVSTDTLGGIIKRVRIGEAFDVVLAPWPAIDAFVRDGSTAVGGVTLIATAGMGVAVRAGAPKPDISSPEALKSMLLAAKSFSYPDPRYIEGNSALGMHIMDITKRLGIAEAMQQKTLFSRTNDVGGLIARGEAELGIAQLQNLGRSKGIDIVGPLPAELQDLVRFTAAIMASTKNPDAAKSLLGYLLAPEAAGAIRAHRMEPAKADSSGSR